MFHISMVILSREGTNKSSMHAHAHSVHDDEKLHFDFGYVYDDHHKALIKGDDDDHNGDDEGCQYYARAECDDDGDDDDDDDDDGGYDFAPAA